MSSSAIPLRALVFPLHGSRLIEASAGTGKTWTIAALYVRLVLGHGGEHGYLRPLLPSEILVMTFTRAATRELSNRVRERLVEAAAYFRAFAGLADDAQRDDYLDEILSSYPDVEAQQQAAHRLMLAAETMDEAAIFTIDAWCQRMLREHAFDSGSLFDEELLSDEQALYEDAAHDYWRQQVYPLNAAALKPLLSCWADVGALKKSLRELTRRADLIGASQAAGCSDAPLGSLIAQLLQQQLATLSRLKLGWIERVDAMEGWINAQRAAAPKCFHGGKMKPESLASWFASLRDWASDPQALRPELKGTGWDRLTPDGISDALTKDFTGTVVPDCFDGIAALKEALAQIEPLSHALYRHAVGVIAARMAELKQRNRQFGFADMLDRLNAALQGENAAALRKRITEQYPVALVDEFQDTAPNQYQIFNQLYRVAENDRNTGLFLIGDPKQSIYGFRGADIHSYLSARSATEGRHYQLGTNYRSTLGVVEAVNHLFLYAENGADGGFPRGGFPRGAFRFRVPGTTDNPLPFEAVAARGRAEQLCDRQGAYPALVLACSVDSLKAEAYRDFFAWQCAEQIVAQLNDEHTGFSGPKGFVRLQPADIAVLVRDRREAGAIRTALQRRGVASVYLSDKDAVTESEEAGDVLRWLSAVASPLDGALARAAFATRTCGLSLAELARLSCDELAWEVRVEQLKGLHSIWQRQGVLAMLRRFIHELELPVTLINQPGGERRLTNLLHLAELLQSASRQLEGEQALIRWLAEQIEGGEASGDERVLRLESDAELVKVITVHKSKGLEYPLVYLPFAVTARKVERRNRSFFEFSDEQGQRQIDMALTEAALALMEQARIQEDLRLLYVALTRARHYLWLGMAPLASRKEGENTLHESALGYLLTGGVPLDTALVLERWQHATAGCPSISVQTLAPEMARSTRLQRVEQRPALRAPLVYSASFERDWSVGSFSSLARRTGPTGTVGSTLPVPRDSAQEDLLEGAELPQQGLQARVDEIAWHRFPRGSVPGNFLHEQLEWLAREGFASVGQEHFPARLARRVERAGWGNRLDDTQVWLRHIVTTPLPYLQAPLSELAAPLPEMEFWFPSERLQTAALDALCAQYMLNGVSRPALPERELHGMLKGFADLVFEHQGRYWVLDYKSNALGGNDAAYHSGALVAAMAEHRYDIQGAIYMLALHRLLQSRLGDAYDPARQLGGAIFMFLRGIANQHTRGCYLIDANPALLDGLDQLFDAPATAQGKTPHAQ